jgi:hypothetical protein
MRAWARGGGGPTIRWFDTRSLLCDAMRRSLPCPRHTDLTETTWSTGVPSHNDRDGDLYMLGMVHFSGNFHIW